MLVPHSTTHTNVQWDLPTPVCRTPSPRDHRFQRLRGPVARPACPEGSQVILSVGGALQGILGAWCSTRQLLNMPTSEPFVRTRPGRGTLMLPGGWSMAAAMHGPCTAVAIVASGIQRPQIVHCAAKDVHDRTARHGGQMPPIASSGDHQDLATTVSSAYEALWRVHPARKDLSSSRPRNGAAGRPARQAPGRPVTGRRAFVRIRPDPHRAGAIPPVYRS
jgi:hypothetical protein